MYFTPTTFMVKLLAAMQVLVILDMPLSTTLALPVTSKPIESTVENSAWQAWIELPPEQKQRVKSRKVTPKSIFTLPLRVECPEGHKQVDTKCIPIIVGTNDVLIDLNALGLLVGNTPAEDIYDYDDAGEEMVANPYSFGKQQISVVGEAEKSIESLNVELKPPSKDEPLKFNIFENKFQIFHEEPSEDYTPFSNEGLQSSEKEPPNAIVTQTPSNTAENVTAINDLASEASNYSENNFDFYIRQDKNLSSSATESKDSNSFPTVGQDTDFKIDAISVSAFGFETENENKSSIHSLDTDERDKLQESDIQTLLQTESFLPLLNQATTLQNSGVDESFSHTTIPLQEPNESSADALDINIDEEITTLRTVVERDLELKSKQEYIRSATLNPTLTKDGDGDIVGIDDDTDYHDNFKDSTLETVTNIEPLETTTPIQLDETTVIETDSFLSTTLSTQQPEQKELVLQQEQTQQAYEELQRMRKYQADQHVVLKKSKVQPVEATTSTTATTISSDESFTAATVTPLLAVHNENDNDNNNDRFYYKNFENQNNQPTKTQHYVSERQETPTTTAATILATGNGTAASLTQVETIPLTSEIDLVEEESRSIHGLVKGIPVTNIKKTTTITTFTTTTTEKPKASTMKIISTDDIQTNSSLNSLSESSTAQKNITISTTQIWSKIMPLLITTTAVPTKPKSSNNEIFKQQQESNSTLRSNRNSKIIRINNFNSISAAKLKTEDSRSIYFAKETPTPTITTTTTGNLKDATTSMTTSTTSTTNLESSENQKSSEESNTFESYWWLPAAWRLNKTTNSKQQQEEEAEKLEEEVKPTEEQPLLLRFWSAYTRTPISS